MPTHISVNDALSLAAHYLLPEQATTEKEKAKFLPLVEYNLLVKAFNVSTILLTAAAVSALFLSFTTSFVFLALGLFCRSVAEKELIKRVETIAKPEDWEATEVVVFDFAAWKNSAPLPHEAKS